jgi:DNA polymerase (family 10)
MHTTETDGKDDVRAMALAAKAEGHEYIAITDHTQALAMANGLDERRALAHAARIRAVDAEDLGIRLLAGVECDIRPDGTLDLADDCLAALDVVVVSVHSAFNQERQQMTERLLRALENSNVDILGHPTGRMMPPSRSLPVRHRSSSGRRVPPRCRAGDQLAGLPARSE